MRVPRGRVMLVVLLALLARGTAHAQSLTRNYEAATAHDFACVTCHPGTPGEATTGAGYQAYDARTNPDFAGGTVRVASGPGSSLLCLGCHDGTVTATNRALTPIAGGSKTAHSLGTDLRNDHPVGFSYATALASGRKALVAKPPPELKLFGPDQRMECSTCHDLHLVGAKHLLRLPIEADALCIACHM